VRVRCKTAICGAQTGESTVILAESLPSIQVGRFAYHDVYC